MEKIIPVPKLLEKCAARDLNNKMLTSNRSFVFLGESDIMINIILKATRHFTTVIGVISGSMLRRRIGRCLSERS